MPPTNFRQYDNDNDGDIDLVNFIYSGPNTWLGLVLVGYRWAFCVPEAVRKRTSSTA